MNTETVKTGADLAAGGITVATVMGYMPMLAAVLTAIYTAARLMETRIFQKCLRAVCAKCAAWWEA